MSSYSTTKERVTALRHLASSLTGHEHFAAWALASRIEDGERFGAANVVSLAGTEADLRSLIGFVDRIAGSDPQARGWAADARRQLIEVMEAQTKEDWTPNTLTPDDDETDNDGLFTEAY